MNKKESKYFNTAIKMDLALLTLLEKKDFPYITVKEICEQAGVNRSTFYLHYENTAELLKETTDYIAETFFSYFSDNLSSVRSKLWTIELKELIFITPEYLTPYLTFIKENRRLFGTALKQRGLLDVYRIYDGMLREVIAPVLERFGVSEKSKDYILRFYLEGITAIVMKWVEGECLDSTEYICDVIIDCVIGKLNEQNI